MTESTFSAKRITLFTYGSRGDVELFAALGVAKAVWRIQAQWENQA